MYNIRITELPYHRDSTQLYACVRDLPWSMYLDSCHTTQGRYDIITAQPFITVTTHGDQTHIQSVTEQTYTNDNPFSVLKELLHQYPQLPSSLPFTGGALGYFSYDLARTLENLPNLAKPVINAPEMAVGIYDWAIIVDNKQKKTYLTQGNNSRETAETIALIKARLKQKPTTPSTPFELNRPLQSNTNETAYRQAFEKIQSYLSQGDCYQINYAHCFSAPFRGDSWAAYQRLRTNNPVPFAAFLNLPNLEILSLSPERFLQAHDNQVISQPIKGTAQRATHAKQDQQFATQLCSSAKDRAENIMIVDLIRNDLSKNCQLDSVRASDLCHIQSFSGVHHLVSTITGTLRQEQHALDVLRDCFPGGSITGAPKIRAMQIIEELEQQKRSVYCGAIGYVSFSGSMDMNIPIRTLICENNRIYCSVGGGIVADSTCDKEYNETLTKVAVIKQCLESNIIIR